MVNPKSPKVTKRSCDNCYFCILGNTPIGRMLRCIQDRDEFEDGRRVCDEWEPAPTRNGRGV